MTARVDALLRGAGRHRPGTAAPWGELIAITTVAAFGYGAVMGLFGGRALQALYSAVKVPLLLGISTLLCTPSFFVVNTTLGLRDDFAAAWRGIVAAQGTVAVCLLSLAPVTFFGYRTSDDYNSALVLNGLVFALASVGGQVTLGRHYQPLIAGNPRHRIARNGWLLLYWFVTIQLAWVLRPFVGAAGLPTVFLRPSSWSNAYVELAELVWRTAGG